MGDMQTIKFLQPCNEQMQRIIQLLFFLVALALLHQQRSFAEENTEPRSTKEPSESQALPGLSESVISVPPPIQTSVPQLSRSSEMDEIRSMVDRAQDRSMAAERRFVMLFFLVIVLTPVIFACGLFFAKYKGYQQLHQKFRLMIENGTPIPAELLSSSAPKPLSVPKPPGQSDFRRGILLVVFGAGAAILLGVALPRGAWSLGLIPIFIGAGYLILWKLDQRKEVL
jgi:hypothetical protein